jgi:hypothetical protein
VTDIEEIRTDAVVSAYTGLLVSDLDGVYQTYSQVLGESILTHQLLTAHDIVKKALLRQHPWLGELSPPPSVDQGGSVEEMLRWMGQVGHEHGETVPVAYEPDSGWVHGNALNDLARLVGRDRIIPVVITEEDE